MGTVCNMAIKEGKCKKNRNLNYCNDLKLMHDNIGMYCFNGVRFDFCLPCKKHSLNNDKCSFYTPVWKTGLIMPWQCPSVRPSVRVFRTFLQHALRCQFETWYIHSVGGTIIIGSLWPSLQPKVGQTYFLQSWPHKSIYSSNLVHRWPAVYFST